MSSASTTAAGPARALGAFMRRDVGGLVLVAAAVIWTFVAAIPAGSPWLTAGMLVLAAAGYTLGRLSGRRRPALVPGLVVAVAILLGILASVGALPEGADAPPLGYVNARAAFFVEAAVAAVMVALALRARVGRILLLTLAAGLAAVPLFSRSHAASFVVVLLPSAAAIALEGRRMASAVWLSGVIMVSSVVGTSLLAAAPPDSAPVRAVGDIVGERRVELWRDGLDLMLHAPLTGVGPGRFEAESPTAQLDRDARWAHHGFLQQGAETGVVGFALLMLIFVWGFWRLASVPDSGMAVMGAFALAALGVLACSDYVFHFPLVTGATAALVGSAVGSSRVAGAGRRRLDATRGRWGGGRAESLVDAGLSRSPLQPIFQSRADRKLSVLAYHGIDQPERFEEHLAYLRETAHPVSLSEVLETIRGRRGLPPGAVLVTFDDGDRSVFEAALPALRSAGIPGVAFVVAGLLDTDDPYWWDEVERLVQAGARLPELNGQGPEHAVRLLKGVSDERRVQLIEDLRRQRPDVRVRGHQLRTEDLDALEAGGIEVGNHSLTHPLLGRCSDEQVREEIGEAHRILVLALGHPPESFAYPDGEWDERAGAALRDLGYEAAFLFDHRASTLPVEDPLRISRLRVNAGTTMDRFRTIVSGLHPALHHLRGAGRIVEGHG
jgi:peptidoglycan/xylan/chitin deacetylase (PgdA/CDA1 family)/O-antigen ligase